jgi:AcrR family transcriptional regulator
MMNKPQQARSEETRTKILQIAMDLFSKAGYEATGVAEICEKCGISKGAFYHHFATKQGVFLELLEKWLSDLEAAMEQAARDSKSVPEAFRAMASSMKGIMQIADGRISIFLEFWIQARRDPEVWERTIKPFRHYRRIFELLIGKGVQEGSFKDIDPALAAHTLVSFAVGALLQGVVDPEGAKWDDILPRSIEFYLQAMMGRRT